MSRIPQLPALSRRRELSAQWLSSGGAPQAGFAALPPLAPRSEARSTGPPETDDAPASQHPTAKAPATPRATTQRPRFHGRSKHLLLQYRKKQSVEGGEVTLEDLDAIEAWPVLLAGVDERRRELKPRGAEDVDSLASESVSNYAWDTEM